MLLRKRANLSMAFALWMVSYVSSIAVESSTSKLFTAPVTSKLPPSSNATLWQKGSGAHQPHAPATVRNHGNNSCDILRDTVKVNPRNASQFLKCERRSWRPNGANNNRTGDNDTHLLIVGAEWKPYNCEKKTLKECTDEFLLERNVTKGLFASPGDYDYESFGGGERGANAVSPFSNGECNVSSPPSPGAICCASQSAHLEIDQTDAQYYLQCVPTQGTQSQFGTWVRMQCPSSMVFNSAAQLCLNLYGAPLGGNQSTDGSFTVSPGNFVPPPAAQPSAASSPNLPVCPDGSKSNLLCNGLYCPKNYFCHNGGCCLQKENGDARQHQPPQQAAALTTSRCPGAEMPTKICSDKLPCPSGQYCHQMDVGINIAAGFCCHLPVTNKPSNATSDCPNGFQPLATVPVCSIKDPCPFGYLCTNSRRCCKDSDFSLCPGGGRPLEIPSVCSATLPCPYGYVCSEMRRCCTKPSEVTCPDGSLPSPRPAVCTANGQCAVGFECTLGNVCCRIPGTPNIVNATARLVKCSDLSEPLATPPSCSTTASCPLGYECTIEGVCCKTFEKDYKPKQSLIVFANSSLNAQNMHKCPSSTVVTTIGCDNDTDCISKTNGFAVCFEGRCCRLSDAFTVSTATEASTKLNKWSSNEWEQRTAVSTESTKSSKDAVIRPPAARPPDAMSIPSTTRPPKPSSPGLVRDPPGPPGAAPPASKPPASAPLSGVPVGYSGATGASPGGSAPAPAPAQPGGVPATQSTSEPPKPPSTAQPPVNDTTADYSRSTNAPEPSVPSAAPSNIPAEPPPANTGSLCSDGTAPLKNPSCQNEFACPAGFLCDGHLHLCCPSASVKTSTTSSTEVATVSGSSSSSNLVTSTSYVTAVAYGPSSYATKTRGRCPSNRFPLAKIKCEAGASKCPINYYCEPSMRRCCYSDSIAVDTSAPRSRSPPTVAFDFETQTAFVTPPPAFCTDGSLATTCTTKAECSVDYDCIDGKCCRSVVPHAPAHAPPDQKQYFCSNGRKAHTVACDFSTPCPVGYKCEGSSCCPSVQCQDGTAPLTQPQFCDARTRCPTNYECQTTVCCAAKTKPSKPAASLSIYHDKHCPDGGQALANVVCYNYNACPSRYICQNGLCCKSTAMCPDGGAPLSYVPFCTDSYASGQKSGQICPSGYSCIDNVCCRDPYFRCSEGSQPLANWSPCDDFYSSCPSGYGCENTFCCPSHSKAYSFYTFGMKDGYDLSTVLCPDGLAPLPTHPSCDAQNLCPATFTCVNFVCCRQKNGDQSTPTDDKIKCNSSNECQTGYECLDNYCCRKKKPDKCPDSTVSGGPCSSDGSRKCPLGYWCKGNICCPKRSCPNGVEPLSTPASCSSTSDCPMGYLCINQFCCRQTGIAICSDGAPPLTDPKVCGKSASCPVGYECQTLEGYQNVCCSSRQPGFCPRGAKSTLRCNYKPSGGQGYGSYVQSGYSSESYSICPAGFYCEAGLGLCCPTTPEKPTTGQACPDGTVSSQPCDRYAPCQPGYACITNRNASICCPVQFDTTRSTRPPICKNCNRYGWKNVYRISNSYSTPLPPAPLYIEPEKNAADAPWQFFENGVLTGQFFKCPDGRLAESICQSDNDCARSYICTSGRCCKSKHVTNLRFQAPCPGYVSPSIRPTACGTNNQCPNGYFCPYTSGICCPTPNRCPDGTQSLSTICIYDSQCPTGFNCPPAIGHCCRQTIRTCPDNTQSLLSPCSSSSHCAPGYYCPLLVGACCSIGRQKFTNPSPPMTMCSGSVTLSTPCSMITICPANYYCNFGTCCPLPTTQPPVATCPSGLPSVGPCVNGICGAGYVCNLANNLCCTPACQNGLIPVGPCVNNQCGTGFTCNTATNMCCPSLATCANGAQAVGPCVNGACGAGFACNSTTNLCCPACPGGGQPVGTCFAGGVCGTGFSCINNICCVSSTTNNVCSDGSAAVGPCFPDGTCDGGFTCQSNVCCPPPGGIPAGATCQDGSVAIGPCLPDGTCGDGNVCNANGFCCPPPGVRSIKKNTCPNNMPSRGKCVDGGCPTPGYACNQMLNLCCPSPFHSIETGCPPGSIHGGHCSTEKTCPGELVCLVSVDVCCSPTGVQMCPNRQPSFGKCSAGVCSTPGLVCIGSVNLCCPAATCANGQAAVGNCVSGQCGMGFTCETPTNLCCPTATSSQHTFAGACPDLTQPIPVTCRADGDCPVGYHCPGGLNTCCLAPAFSSPTPNRCPDTTVSSGSCVGGLCGVGYSCLTPSYICCTSSTVTQAPAACPDGSSPVGVCINGQCGPTFTCTSSNLCCPVANTVNTVVCPDMTQPAGACIGGLCGSGFTCIPGNNICCPGNAAATTRCLDGTAPAGPCVNNLCGVGFTCTTGNLCCPQQSGGILTALCPDSSQPADQCLNGLCSSPYQCTPDNLCCLPTNVQNVCPNGVASEPCNADGASCPTAGFVCVDGFVCCNLGNTNTGTVSDCVSQVPGSLGPCINGLCPGAFFCEPSSSCCMPTGGRANPGGGGALMGADFDPDAPPPPMRPRPFQAIHDLWPSAPRGGGLLAHSFGDIYPSADGLMCPGNRPAAAACRYGLCLSGYTCYVEKNLCCPINPRTTAFGTDGNGNVGIGQRSGLPPGSPCVGYRSSECNGAVNGMAACIKKVCMCLPPAKSNGQFCVMPPKQSLVRSTLGRPYYAHSHIYPGVLSDALVSVNETSGNETTSATPATTTTMRAPIFPIKPTLSRTVGCGKAADCDASLREQCVNGTCITPKAPGEPCTSIIECSSYCVNTECSPDGRGGRTCACPEKMFRHGRKCFSKCPPGTRARSERRDCEEINFSVARRDSVTAHDDNVKLISVC